MNTIRDLRTNFNINNATFAEIINVNISTISTMLDRDVNTLTVKQLCSLQKELKTTFNELLGEKVFTPQNIDSQVVSNKIEISDELLDAIISRLKGRM